MTDTAAATPPPIHAHLLGEVRLAVGDRVVPDQAWRRRAERSLLLLLLMTPGHQLPRDRLLDLLWPEAPSATALNSLYKALHAMRRILEPDLARGRASAYIETGAELIALRPIPGTWVDVDAFTAALARAQAAGGDDRRVALREAVTLYTGDLLESEPYTDWPVARRESLRLARERALLELADLDFAAGEPLITVPLLENLLASERAHEETHRRLIRAFAAAGLRERAERQFQRCQQVMAEDLGTTPSPQTAAALASARVNPDTAAPAGPRHSHRFHLLPPPTKSFVGRRREIEAVEGRLWRQDVRLVTLTGPAGIGKTQLALAVARGMVDEFADGIAFIPLATLHNPALVPHAIAEQLGQSVDTEEAPLPLLSALLREREILLILDNFEQLLPAATYLAELLAMCPQLKLLVTSRERLALRGEHEFPVPPLALPNPARLPDADSLANYEAAALFLERVRAVVPEFQLTTEQAHDIAKLCLRLEGLPLAIELAAAQGAGLPPAAVLERLTYHLNWLSDLSHDAQTHQRTLRETLDWSYHLLAPEEQTLFRRLAVFANGCTEAAAIEVAADPVGPAGTQPLMPGAAPVPPDAVFDGLISLIDKSLLRRIEQDDEAPRYRMLAVVHDYGRERLAADGTEALLRDRHAAYFLALAEEARRHNLTAAEPTWHERLNADRDNLQAALAWLLAQQRGGEALRLAIALHWFWHIRCRFAIGSTWLETALAAAADAAEPPEIALPRRADGLFALGLMVWATGDFARARASHEESLAICRELGDAFGIARAVLGRGDLERRLGHFAAAERDLTDALARFRALGDTTWTAMTLTELSPVIHGQDEPERARPVAAEALALCRTIGYPWGIAQAAFHLAEIWRDLGDLDHAAPLFAQSLVQYRVQRDRWGTADALAALAAIAARQQPERATRLFGAAAALHTTLGFATGATADTAYAVTIADLRQTLGESAFTAAWEAGSLLSPEEATTEAAALEPVAGSPPSTALDQTAPDDRGRRPVGISPDRRR